MSRDTRHRWSVLSLLSAAVVLCVFTLQACNTVQGAGEDLENAGEAVQDAAD